MLNKIMYPICANTFKNWCLSNYKYGKVYHDLGEPRPFDVSLRDGLQSLTNDEQKCYTTNEKIKIYNSIKTKYNPKNIEIGSIVSEKVLPVFKDTLDLFKLIEVNQQLHHLSYEDRANNFILTPNQEKMREIINIPEINNLSFITSVSNSFQKRNTKLSLHESDKDISTMLQELDNARCRKSCPVVKLYVSCINECPIEGKIDNDFIVNRLLNLHKMKVDYICLSDTCGTLTVDDFEYIVDTCAYFGLPYKTLSLHLHVKKGREKEVENIIHKALDRQIIHFDVSALDSGGCSVTMTKDKLSPNLSYELYYKSLSNYIIRKIQWDEMFLK